MTEPAPDVRLESVVKRFDDVVAGLYTVLAVAAARAVIG